MTSDRVAILTEFTGGAPALRSGIYQDVGESMYLIYSTTGMYAGKSLITMGNVGPLLLAEFCYVVVKRNWLLRGFDVFWKRRFVSLSSLDVFFFPGWLALLFVWFGRLFGLFHSLRTSSLLHFHLFSHNLSIVDRPQTFWWPSEPRARAAWATKKSVFYIYDSSKFVCVWVWTAVPEITVSFSSSLHGSRQIHGF